MSRAPSRRVALLSGGGSGIGRAVAQRLLSEGYCLSLLDLEFDGIAEWARSEGFDRYLDVRRCDVSRESEVESAVTAGAKRWGRIDAAITAAGVLSFAHASDTPLSMWEWLISVNMTGTFLVCRAVLPYLERSGGCLVTTASTAALAGLAYGSAYAASKGGVIAYTRALSVEYARRGVRANCVCPGGVDTAMTQSIRLPEDVDISLIHRQLPLADIAKPDAMAGIYSYLISVDARHMTGEVVRVDGGMLA